MIRDLKKIPSAKYWIASFAAIAAFLTVAWFAMPDFANLDARPGWPKLGIIALVAFFFPALFEELVFRGWLNRTQTPRSIVLSTAAFVLWHPVVAWLLVKRALPYMTDYRFLIFVAIFGILSCLMRKFSGSLWPSILTHWAVAVTWKGLGGAQFLT